MRALFLGIQRVSGWLRISIMGLLWGYVIYEGLAIAQTQKWHLNVGEMRVLQFEEVARVAVGDGHVLNAVAAENKEVLVFAKNEGHSSLYIWTADGQRFEYEVQVQMPAQADAMQELTRILERIPNINFSQVGSKIVVEGEQLTSHQRQQLMERSEERRVGKEARAVIRSEN